MYYYFVCLIISNCRNTDSVFKKHMRLRFLRFFHVFTWKNHTPQVRDCVWLLLLCSYHDKASKQSAFNGYLHISSISRFEDWILIIPF